MQWVSVPKSKISTAAAGILYLITVSAGGTPVTGSDHAEHGGIETIEVIGAAPVSGAGPDDRLPFSFQSFGSEDLERLQSNSLAEFLLRRAGSVSVNDAQNNPLQPDFQFRGFTASPLLGLPQGIAVYQNGVRLNEVFGDSVNWDLVPESTVESIHLVAGSNPAFGLNALGGAVIVDTIDGFSSPGKSISLGYGSHERRQAELVSGGNNGRWGYALALDHFDENGWRDFSDSRAGNLYGALSWRGDVSEIDIYLNGADTRLRGNGAAPVSLLRENRAGVFTHPDITENRMGMLSLASSHWLRPDTRIDLNLYYRHITTRSFNGDGSEFETCEPPLDGFLCEEDEAEPVADSRGRPVSAAYDAINNASRRRQHSWGVTLQGYLDRHWAGIHHHIILGSDYLDGSTDFDSSVEFAELTESRSTTRTGLFAGEGFTHMVSDTRTISGYITDTLALSSVVDLTVSARFNDSVVKSADRSGERPELDGRHRYRRLNAGAGLSWRVSDNLSAYGGWQQSSRTPTPVELACSHEDAPCTLPNTFLADPPLDDVVARTFEVGVRGGSRYLDHWSLGIFSTTNRNDIIFQTTGGVSSNEGFFTNVGDTRRLALEMNLAGSVGRLQWYLNYTWLRATFEEAFFAFSPSHPSAREGAIPVEDGDRIPGLPEHNLKAGGVYRFSDALQFGVDMIASSGIYLRGDEGNLDSPTGGYAVVNLTARYQPGRHLVLTAQVKNLFDREYETFGLYGEAGEILEDVPEDETRFLSPAAPRGVWVGVKYLW